MTSTTHLLQADPFTVGEAEQRGLGRKDLHRLVLDGVLRHPIRGVYLGAEQPDDIDTRVACINLALPPHVVVSDRTAAWLHGIDILAYAELDEPPPLEVVSVGGRDRTQAAGTLGGKRDLRADEITEVGGIRVTTPLRTACDIACLRGRLRAFATLNEFRRKHGITRADLKRMLPRYTGRRGVIQLRELIPLTTPDAESQPESWCWLIIHDEQLPTPRPQVWVMLPDGQRCRVENGYEHLRIAVEYDGVEFHTATEDTDHDEIRREALRRNGWIIIVVRKDGFAGEARERWLRELRDALAERAPRPSPKRIYSRGPDNPMYRRRRTQS